MNKTITKNGAFKGWLVSRGIRQKEIADLLDIGIQSVNNKLNGKSEFTLPQIRTICEHYNISADIFVDNTL
ncbi:MAG: helix-turn-helix domain-containing protein [Aeriscardovia sp.]|nr:helix-turn-helix domain-containing protein [Aeriscardovia sp.]